VISESVALNAAAIMGGMYFLAAGTNQLLRLLDRMKEQPPPIETYATKDELGALRTELRDAIGGFKMDLHNLSEKLDAGQRRVHGRVDDVLRAVSRLEGRMDRMGST